MWKTGILACSRAIIAALALGSLTIPAWAAPEMMVVGNTIEIVDGDSSPSTADHSDFGDADVASQTVTRSFVISNTGVDPLNLTGTPRVSITGTHAADFLVTAQPATPVAAFGGTTFSIQFDPNATGVRSALVTIVNDDDNENPYTFAIQGTGFNNQSPTAVTSASDGSGDLSSTITLSGSGSSDPDGLPQSLSYSWAFTSGPVAPSVNNDDQQVATFSTTTAGTYVFTLTVSDGLATDTETATVLVGISEIAVTGNGTDISNGDTTPSTGDYTIFSDVYVGEGASTRTFMIENEGGSNLILSGSPAATISGTHATDFSVTTQPSSTIAAGSSSAMVIRFNPSATGVRTAIVSIANNDSDESPFTFTIQGTANARPEINIVGNGRSISDGDDSPREDDHTDFGAARISGGRVRRTFTIENLGTGELRLTDSDLVDIYGIGNSAFEVTRPPASVIPAGGSTTFEITFNPDVTGTHTAEVEIDCNDSNESTYTFEIEGEGNLFSDDDGGCNLALGGGFGWLLPLLSVLSFIAIRRRR